MVPLLAVGVGVMTLSLNLQGYVKDPASPIYVKVLAKFAQPVRTKSVAIIIACSVVLIGFCIVVCTD